MASINKSISVLLLCILFCGISLAQFNVFLGAGGSYYAGDLKNTMLPGIRTTHLSGKLGVGYDWSNWGIRLQSSLGSYSGNDHFSVENGRYQRGISFKANYVEVGLALKYKFPFAIKQWNPYLMGGVEALIFNPKVNYIDAGLPLVAENSFSNKQIAIPLAIGVGRRLNEHWGVAIESTYHFTFTDYLDGVSLNGNSKIKDALIESHVTLFYYFSSKKNGAAKESNYQCPTFK